MKDSFLAIATLIIVSLTSSCASRPSIGPDGKVIPPDVEVISVLVNQTPEQAFKDIKMLAVSEGYSIKSADRDTLSLVTEFKTYSYGSLESSHSDVSLHIVVLKNSNNYSKIRIRGKVRQPITVIFNGHGSNVTEISASHKGMKGSILRNGWDAIYDFALKVGKNHEYSK